MSMIRKVFYVIIALLFGSFGFHNFIFEYSANKASGFTKLILTICGCLLFGYSSIIFAIIQAIVGIWVLADILYYCIKDKSLLLSNIFKKANENK